MKQLRITSSKIEVSANSHVKEGYLAFHKVKGILPNGRKTKVLTFSPMSRYIGVRGLYGYNGTARIKPSEWAELVNKSEIVVNRFSPYPLSPDVLTNARLEALKITNCAAIVSREHVHPSYEPCFDPMEIVSL